MQKNNKVYLIVLAAGVLLTAGLFWKNHSAVSHENISYQDSVLLKNEEINAGLKDFRLSEIIKDSALLERIVGKDSPRLVLRVAETQCEACVDQQYLLLLKHLAGVKEHIVLLETMRSRANNRGRKVAADWVNVSDSIMEWEPEYYCKPYYFVVHPDRHVSHIFVPDLYIPQYTEDYFEKIKPLID